MFNPDLQPSRIWNNSSTGYMSYLLSSSWPVCQSFTLNILSSERNNQFIMFTRLYFFFNIFFYQILFFSCNGFNFLNSTYSTFKNYFDNVFFSAGAQFTTATIQPAIQRKLRVSTSTDEAVYSTVRPCRVFVRYTATRCCPNIRISRHRQPFCHARSRLEAADPV